MERATLRPVPQRPSAPVAPAEALAHVEETLPTLDAAARQALALAELVGRARPELHAETGLSEEELSTALARARKALRSAVMPLPGTGWCERAERLLSDELDGVLAEPGPRRLAAHLGNCDRCVEHERRLWQARDQLVARFEEARAAAAPGPKEAPPLTGDEQPDREPLELPDPQPEPPATEEPGPAAPPAGDPPVPAQPAAAAPPELRLVEPAAEVPAPTVPEPADPAPAEPQPAEPEPAEPAPAAGEAPFSTPSGRSLRSVAWAASMAIAVALAILSLALTVFAIAGGGI